MTYRLSNKAVDDIVQIWSDGAENFGADQAERYHAGLEQVFRFLADNPRAARSRTEISPPVRAHPYKAHLVVYDIGPDGNIVILRVRHGREDWVSDPLQEFE